MPELIPVDHDPFAAPPSGSDRAPLRITVGSRQPQLVPVDHDPFAPIGFAEDVLKSAGGGLIKGMAGLVGLPELAERGIGFAVDQTLGRAISGIKSRGKDFSAGTAKRPDDAPPSLLPSARTAQDAIETVTGKAYEPQTTAGHYAQTAAEFVPGAMAPGGVVRNAVRFGVVPGFASEAAGQITKGTQYELLARVAGGFAGIGAAAMFSRPGTAARAIREQLPEGVTPQMVDDASALIARADQQGVQLAWPEALSQVAGRPVLTNVMRHLEAAPQTEARMAEFFGQRPQQIETAGRQAMDQVAPVNNAPQTIGREAGNAAEGIVEDVRGAINTASEPFYTRAANTIIPPADFARVQAVPGYAHAVRAIQRDPQLARYVHGLPENSVGYVNEVKKWLDAAAENATQPVGAHGRNMQRSAGFSTDATTARDAAVRASSDYETALAIQSQGRERFLQPLLDGPLGKMANSDRTTKAAIDALFPANPVPNSAGVIAQTVGALAQRSPRAAADLVRAHTESVFNEATQALQSGANQAGGAKFRAVLVGNPQQRANFEAAVTALPHGADRLAGFNRFLEVAAATGARQGVGSRTAYNADMLKSQAASGVIGESAKALSNPLGGGQFLADKYKRWRLGQNLGELANILTSPAAVNQLRAIARMPPGARQAEAVAIRLANITRSSTLPRSEQNSR